MVLVCREDGRKSRRSGLVFATVGLRDIRGGLDFCLKALSMQSWQ